MTHTTVRPDDRRPVIEDREQLRVELERLYDKLLIEQRGADADGLTSALDAAFELSQQLQRELQLDALTLIAEGLLFGC